MVWSTSSSKASFNLKWGHSNRDSTSNQWTNDFIIDIPFPPLLGWQRWSLGCAVSLRSMGLGRGRVSRDQMRLPQSGRGLYEDDTLSAVDRKSHWRNVWKSFHMSHEMDRICWQVYCIVTHDLSELQYLTKKNNPVSSSYVWDTSHDNKRNYGN